MAFTVSMMLAIFMSNAITITIFSSGFWDIGHNGNFWDVLFHNYPIFWNVGSDCAMARMVGTRREKACPLKA